MSGAILFAAIVVIWAGMLVPRWVRKSHAVPEPESAAAPENLADQASLAADPDLSAADPDLSAADPDLSAADPDSLAAAEPGDPADEMAVPRAAHTRYRHRTAGSQAAPSSQVNAAFRTGRGRSPGPGPAYRVSPAGPAASRTGVIRARRRLLTLLVTLLSAVGASAATGVGRWWMVVPPAGMLVGYLLLLREAGRADAEAAQFQALARAEAAAARAARARARETEEQARLAEEARRPQPTAQIINISGRVDDQLYDQYADAAARAVGD